MLSNVRRKIVDLDRTEQKAEREYLRTVHNGCVTAESALSVHYQQRHLIYNVSVSHPPVINIIHHTQRQSLRPSVGCMSKTA